MPTLHERLKVFVYGTLKPGYINYQRYCHGWVTQEQRAIARGQLFDLALGYPAMTGGKGWVRGVLLEFASPDILPSLDRLEDYQAERPPHQNLYDRQWIEVFDLTQQSLGWAWAYLMAPDRIQQLQGTPLAGGCWLP